MSEQTIVKLEANDISLLHTQKRTPPNFHLESVLKVQNIKIKSRTKTYDAVLSRIMRNKFVVNL